MFCTALAQDVPWPAHPSCYALGLAMHGQSTSFTLLTGKPIRRRTASRIVVKRIPPRLPAQDKLRPSSNELAGRSSAGVLDKSRVIVEVAAGIEETIPHRFL
ncbi:hypothetical protein CVT26_005302 [Gymnopilus dilepis]|uniref:Uncharacterized protein n=1 Tax=Gymnopilus dilepis TaxID=231916 RepID=A0A409YSU2_9AGAR|nr:hypothetical protein CVT26_005302 [Gymnopilus dilepis]